ncbi:MAG: carbohydrate binding family 9 domain-containing protein [bacterium]|nr:carbohydrate binding family 9 domain-containing protein [bacterium]
MNKLHLALLLVLLSALCAGLATATEFERRYYDTERVSGAQPQIDGILDDHAWTTVEWAGGFREHSPGDGEEPTKQTQFKFLYDNEAVYMAFRAFDDPALVRSILGRRDNFPGDWVEVNIDSRFDHVTAFSFTLSVSGVQGDEFISGNGDNWSNSWDPIWQGATNIDDLGWTAEMRIPLSQLRFSDEEEQTWGIQVARRIFREEERSSWQYKPKDVSGWVSNMGYVRGIRGIKPKRRIELMPYLVNKAEFYEKIEGDPFRTGRGGFITEGLDGKIGVTNDLTLDFTINPDFGQVEADPSQVNLTAFETYQRERRPFFVEGQNIYDFDIAPAMTGGHFTRDNLFYSRRIGRRPSNPWYSEHYTSSSHIDQPSNTSILGAFKLSGKTAGGLSIGVLESVTAKETAELETDGERHDVTVEPLTNYFVGRLEQDFRGGNSQIGAMVTAVNRHIEDEDSHLEYMRAQAYAGGLNLSHIFLDERFYVMADVVGSHLRGSQWAIANAQTSSARYYQRPDNESVDYDPELTELSGHGGSVQLGRRGHGTNFMYQVAGAWRSPGFEINDLGYMRRAAEYNESAWCGYRWREPFGIFNSLSLNANQWLDWDWDGVFLGSAYNMNMHANFKRNWSGGGGISRTNEMISNTMLWGGPAAKTSGDWHGDFYVNSDYRRQLQVGSNGWFNRDDNDNGGNFGGSVDFTYRPNDAMRLTFSPTFSSSDYKMSILDNYELNGQDEYIFARLKQKELSMTFRLDYCLTPKLTIQYYGSPFIASGKYSEFKRITDPMAAEYADRFALFTDDQITRADGEVAFDQDGGGADYAISEPDFNYRAFNSNLVVRWEYQPGSIFYAVWSQARSGSVADGEFNVGSDMGDLFSIHPHNVFLLKISKWFSI